MGHLLYLMFRCDRGYDGKFGKFGNFVGTKHTLVGVYRRESKILILILNFCVACMLDPLTIWKDAGGGGRASPLALPCTRNSNTPCIFLESLGASYAYCGGVAPRSQRRLRMEVMSTV